MTFAKEELVSYIERIERLNDEVEGLKTDIKEIFMEAKANGFDVPTMRECLRLRKMDAADREEREQLVGIYMDALDGTPLGDWAEKKAA